MKKLELKHIVGYLPYGLKIKEKEGVFTQTILGLYSNGAVIYNSWNAPENHTLNDVIPVLRPMKDIYKCITIKGYEEGKGSIPILDIAKKYRNVNWELKDREITYKTSKANYEVISKFKILKDNTFFIEDSYYIREKCKHTKKIPLNILEVIDLLYRWKFDFHYDLIGWKLAVDINTLNK